MQNFMMFIDSNNFYKNSQRLLQLGSVKFRWADLLIGIRDLFQNEYPETKFIKANYYSALSDREDNPKAYDAQKRFLDAIARVAFIDVIIGYLMKKPRSESVKIDIKDKSTYYHVEKNTDVNLSNDILINCLGNGVDIVLLIATDGDYADTINKVKTCGKEIFVVVPEGTPFYKIKSLVEDKNIIYLKESFLKNYLVK